MRIALAAAIAAAPLMLVTVVGQPAAALPGASVASGQATPSSRAGLVHKAGHGGSSCRYGYMPRLGRYGWHRHVGPNRWPVPC